MKNLASASTEHFGEYLNVGEAAAVLGVSPWTLRNWDNSGKLKPLRHPLNGYRMYRRAELEALLPSHDLATDALSAPRIDWSDLTDSRHFVQFYEDEAFLAQSVAGFVAAGLAAGEATIVIATPAHRHAIEEYLALQDVPVAEVSGRGDYIALDAADTLAAFMVGDLPDRERFDDVVGRLIDRAANRGTGCNPSQAGGTRRVRAFGEMVSLLWAEGNQEAAVRIEELWNELQTTRAFSLFCAYPLSGFADDSHMPGFGQVCGCHSHVIPGESYTGLATQDERLLAIGRLQQKARILENEIERRKEVEAELRETDRRKDEFLATLAHELRNPLAPIRTAVEIMQLTQSVEMLDIVERQVTHLVRLVDDLLDASRIAHGKIELRKERVALAAIVHRAVEISRPLVDESGHELTLDVPAKDVFVEADAVRMAQVCSNLLNNAARYSPPASRIRLTVADDGDFAAITVKDNGIGIPAHMQRQIFEMFTQVQSTHQAAAGGLGIGLAIVRRLVAMHDGTVTVRSDGLGQGSEFTVRLPLVKGMKDRGLRIED